MGLLYKYSTGEIIGISVEDEKLAKNIRKLLEVLGHSTKIIYCGDVWAVVVDEKQ